MVWRFLKHYGMNKAGEILDEFAAAVVAFDPQAASHAQIAMMEAELEKLAGRLAEAEAELRREHRETLDLKKTYEQYIRAAEVLQANLADEVGPAHADGTGSSLVRLVDKLERMKPELEREEREDREAEAWCAELRRAFEELGEKIKSARAQLASARREMEVAKLRKDRAADDARRVGQTSGIVSAVGSLTVALDAMNQQTARVQAETEALKLKTDILRTDRIEGDPNIASALAAVRATHAGDRASLRDRLATLTGRHAAGEPKPQAGRGL